MHENSMDNSQRGQQRESVITLDKDTPLLAVAMNMERNGPIEYRYDSIYHQNVEEYLNRYTPFVRLWMRFDCLRSIYPMPPLISVLTNIPSIPVPVAAPMPMGPAPIPPPIPMGPAPIPIAPAPIRAPIPPPIPPLIPMGPAPIPIAPAPIPAPIPIAPAPIP